MTKINKDNEVHCHSMGKRTFQIGEETLGTYFFLGFLLG